MSARQIIGAAEGIAELFDDLAPKTCAAVRNAPPMTGAINHANFSGEEISFPTQGLLWERENQLLECQPGDLGYFVQVPAICIYCGALRVISPGSASRLRFSRSALRWRSRRWERVPRTRRDHRLSGAMPDIARQSDVTEPSTRAGI